MLPVYSVTYLPGCSRWRGLSFAVRLHGVHVAVESLLNHPRNEPGHEPGHEAFRPRIHRHGQHRCPTINLHSERGVPHGPLGHVDQAHALRGDELGDLLLKRAGPTLQEPRGAKLRTDAGAARGEVLDLGAAGNRILELFGIGDGAKHSFCRCVDRASGGPSHVDASDDEFWLATLPTPAGSTAEWWRRPPPYSGRTRSGPSAATGIYTPMNGCIPTGRLPAARQVPFYLRSYGNALPELLGKRNDDALRAADVTEPVHVL